MNSDRNDRLSSVKQMAHLSIIAGLVLVLWFLLGFVLPLFFKDLEESGKFGDGFGAVNSLFGGLGFIGLSYTIYLQVKFNIDQKLQERFTTALNLIDQVKNDLSYFRIENQKGVEAVLALQAKIQDKMFTILDTVFVTYLFGAVSQLSRIIDFVDKNFHKDSEEHNITIDNIRTIYLTYLIRLKNQLERLPLDGRHETELKLFRQILVELSNKVFSPDDIINAYESGKANQ